MYLTNYTIEAVWIDVVTSMRVKLELESKSKVVLNSDIPQILVKETAECFMTGKKKCIFSVSLHDCNCNTRNGISIFFTPSGLWFCRPCHSFGDFTKF